MAVRDVLQLGDPRLKQPTRDAVAGAQETEDAVNDLVDTMRQTGLVGMAAPQLGIPLRLIVTEPRPTGTRSVSQSDELRVYINPVIPWMSEERIIIYEGCGSVVHGNLFGPVLRPKTVTVEATDREGNRFRLKCDGLLARVIQHEYDHLDGIEFTEKIADYRNLCVREWYLAVVKNDPTSSAASEMTLKEYTRL